LTGTWVDARGRTYREIAALIREAKALAEADARNEPDRAGDGARAVFHLPRSV
jgi:hypothetical protein